MLEQNNCVCVCVCACMHACVRACVHGVCVSVCVKWVTDFTPELTWCSCPSGILHCTCMREVMYRCWEMVAQVSTSSSTG